MVYDLIVYVFGEDVGYYGGFYKVIKGFYEKYGELCIFDIFIVENSFIGMVIGLVLIGLWFIIEGMNMGFLLLVFN